MKKKLIALGLSAALLLSISLSGCDSQADPASVPAGTSEVSAVSAGTEGEGDSLYTPVGEYPITNETITLTVLSQQIPNIIDMETNRFTVDYEEKTNIHINWNLVPQDAVEANLNLVLASGEYPDIFLRMGINANQEGLYGGADKIFLPFNEMIDSLMPNFSSLLDDQPKLRNDLTGTDGNIYCLPSFTEYTHVKYAQKMWVNVEWLDAVGLQKPATTDEFYEMLKAFKEQDPNGNGIADEIPLTGVVNTGGGWKAGLENFIMNAFIYDSGDVQSDLRPYVLNDVVDVAVNKDAYREGLRYLNKLYSEGLIDPGAFSNTNDQVKQLVLNEDAPLVGAIPSGHPAMFADITTDHERYSMYEAIAPLEGPDGFRVATRWDDDAEFGIAAVSTTCAYPEAAARWLDGFYDYETSMNRQWGPKGEAWREAEEGELGLGGEPALYKVLNDFDESAQNEHWSWLGIEYTPKELMEGMIVTPEDVDLKSADGFEKMLLTVTEEMYIPYESDEYAVVPNNLRYTEDEAEERNLIRIDIENLAKEYRVQFITGALDLDADWDAFVEALDNMGLPRYLEIENDVYARYIGK